MASLTSTLSRAMDAGALISGDHERDLRRAIDALSDFLRGGAAASSAEALAGDLDDPASVRAHGDAVHRKLLRLLEDLAAIRGQVVELSSIVDLLVRAADGRASPGEVSAGLRLAFAEFRYPYVVIGADGIRRGAGAGDPRIAELPGLSFAVDDLREVIWRGGREISMGRRRLLFRFFRLFALAPGAVFSQEQVFLEVWGGQEYHPLRNSPALFTSVARLRRILGEGGADLLRTCAGGYCLAPPADYRIVTRADLSGSAAHPELTPDLNLQALRGSPGT